MAVRDRCGWGACAKVGLNERTLAIYRRVLGEEHPNTRLSALNLFGALLDLGETEASRGIFEAHLAGLLERNPATLAAQDRRTRERLIALLQSPAASPPVPSPAAEPAPAGPLRGWFGRFRRWLNRLR